MAEHTSSRKNKTAKPRLERYTISLEKDGQTWRFQWDAGNEGVLIDALADMAGDPNHPLDWFDATVVSHQINNSILTEGPVAPESFFDAA